MVPPQKNIFLLLYCIIFDNKFLLILRNSKLLSINFLCVTLSHMSICTGVVVSVTFQQVDNAPYAKTSTKGNHEGLQHIDRFIEKFHKSLLAGIVLIKFQSFIGIQKPDNPPPGFRGVIPAVLLFSLFFGDCPPCTPMAPKGQLRRIDKTTPFIAEQI